MQSQMMALLLRSEGTSVVTETVFENRFMHVDEFHNMNAEIKIEGRSAIVTGNAQLVGAKVCATDLRAGAALILAGLVAEGTTEVSGTHHIDRGYVHLAEKLSGLGAEIWRISMEDTSAQTVKDEVLKPEVSKSESTKTEEVKPRFQVQPTWV
jgi:UDP-N-acetylglucosamine 1-carboxyvinyltransferase